MVAKASVRAPNTMSKTRDDKKALEDLMDRQIAPGCIMLWGLKVALGVFPAAPDPPLGWLNMDTVSGTPVDYQIKDYKQLAYSGSSFIQLIEASGTFRIWDPSPYIYTGAAGSARWIIKT